MIQTERLLLRRWTDADRVPFHAMCQYARVMEYLGDPQPRDATDAMIDRQNGFHDSLGHCFWAMERREDGAFLGFCGVKPGAIDTPLEGRAEIGWRLAADHWGLGYAREAAQATVDWCFVHLADPTVWAMTVPANVRSWGLMERLGMTRRAELDFDHPLPGLVERLKAHIVYSKDRPS